MLRYVLAACTLKAFSATDTTQRIYRDLGNRFGGPLRRRQSYLRSHIARGELFRQLANEYHLTRGDENLLEIGTGWIHWHSIYHRLFFNATISMLDVWDCRQFDALKALFGDLLQSWQTTRQKDDPARRQLEEVLACTTFDDLYRKLGLRYVVREDGSLDEFADESFDAVYSFHVLEHVQKENTPALVTGMHRILKPGGYAIHQIGIDDHLTHYDASASPKNYVQYSDNTWRWFFENELQYFNRLQMSDWTRLFEQAGFKLVRREPIFCDINGLRIHSIFKHYSEEDLRCTILTLVYQKEK